MYARNTDSRPHRNDRRGSRLLIGPSCQGNTARWLDQQTADFATRARMLRRSRCDVRGRPSSPDQMPVHAPSHTLVLPSTGILFSGKEHVPPISLTVSCVVTVTQPTPTKTTQLIKPRTAGVNSNNRGNRSQVRGADVKTHHHRSAVFVRATHPKYYRQRRSSISSKYSVHVYNLAVVTGVVKCPDAPRRVGRLNRETGYFAAASRITCSHVHLPVILTYALDNNSIGTQGKARERSSLPLLSLEYLTGVRERAAGKLWSNTVAARDDERPVAVGGVFVLSLYNDYSTTTEQRFELYRRARKCGPRVQNWVFLVNYKPEPA
ncbi:hypothetical protein EVAR_60885_1 [Eumeta japonica]|uniref:Uncharacterized protein n=1 Tax=Eumeta variegata TaxID=151549 RepID=A0A4C1YFW8_EUMVA|nr:hypothetical protein EVAR_60885_1 [Eumeta japonica]